jgi:hypothetical protein
MRRFTRPALLFLLLLLPALANAGDFPRDEQKVFLQVANQGWKDFDRTTGDAITDDKSMGIGAGWEALFEGKDWDGFWRTRVAAYAGSGDYSEKAQFGEITSKTTLQGMSAEIDYIYRMAAFRYFTLEPLAGLALRMDRRVIGEGSVGSDNTISRRGRYREERRGFCGRLGLRGVVRELGGAADERALDDGSARDIFFEGGLLLPVYMEFQGGLNGERIPSRMYPGRYFEAGVRFGRWQPTVYYEGFRYGTGFGGSDPRAESSVIGVRLGMSF